MCEPDRDRAASDRPCGSPQSSARATRRQRAGSAGRCSSSSRCRGPTPTARRARPARAADRAGQERLGVGRRPRSAYQFRNTRARLTAPPDTTRKRSSPSVPPSAHAGIQFTPLMWPVKSVDDERTARAVGAASAVSTSRSSMRVRRPRPAPAGSPPSAGRSGPSRSPLAAMRAKSRARRSAASKRGHQPMAVASRPVVDAEPEAAQDRHRARRHPARPRATRSYTATYSSTMRSTSKRCSTRPLGPPAGRARRRVATASTAAVDVVDQEAVLAVVDDLGHRAPSEGDDRRAAGHRLDDAEAERLVEVDRGASSARAPPRRSARSVGTDRADERAHGRRRCAARPLARSSRGPGRCRRSISGKPARSADLDRLGGALVGMDPPEEQQVVARRRTAARTRRMSMPWWIVAT